MVLPIAPANDACGATDSTTVMEAALSAPPECFFELDSDLKIRPLRNFFKNFSRRDFLRRFVPVLLMVFIMVDREEVVLVEATVAAESATLTAFGSTAVLVFAEGGWGCRCSSSCSRSCCCCIPRNGASYSSTRFISNVTLLDFRRKNSLKRLFNLDVGDWGLESATRTTSMASSFLSVSVSSSLSSLTAPSLVWIRNSPKGMKTAPSSSHVGSTISLPTSMMGKHFDGFFRTERIPVWLFAS
mmetsp:Transcript_25804/g.44053  ORF Transcript_25804/g.44053 Transcript_25804/m.44053 type:complete len:243 (+) Transcript_25804:757-1485(+)